MAGPDVAAKPGKSEAAEERRWKVERAADALMESEKVRADPALLKDALKELKRRKKELSAALSTARGPGSAVMKGRSESEE
ncbi:MAG TPA: hypothetical protein VMY35_14405 [Phycisphaerae bacterium]|nr:hypothetical protein [Phycisphaerae bacterium]